MMNTETISYKENNTLSKNTAASSEKTNKKLSKYSTEFYIALTQLQSFGLDSFLVGPALNLWNRLEKFGPSEPSFLVTRSKSILFSWNSKICNLTLEFFPDQTYEWFFQNHQSNEVEGTEFETEKELPPCFFEHLKKFSI